MVPFEKQMLPQAKGSAGNMLLARRCNSNIKKNIVPSVTE